MKIQDLCKEFNIPLGEVMGYVRDMGLFKKSASDKLDPGTATKVRGFIKNQIQKKQNQESEEEREAKEVILKEKSLKVSQLVELFDITLPEIMKVFLKQGMLLNVNSDVDQETIQEIGLHLNVDVKIEDTSAEEEIGLKTTVLEMDEASIKSAKNLKERPPVITIMGHVDHGKTLLLDTIRKSNVVDKEAGGITQHIGAYQVDVNGKPLTFLDTPGHEAFTSLRARGAQITDITILVVAADESIKPQTVEAIQHAQAADVPIIVAINKMDKPGADPDKVKQDLTQHNLVSEEWGGETIVVPISAKTGKGIDQLLEMIALTAEMLELKADMEALSKGVVIESNLSKQRGPIATILVRSGTLKVGDFFVVGAAYGKIRALVNDQGQRVKEAGPGAPVEALGFSIVPEPGDILEVKETEKETRQIAEERQIELSKLSDQNQAVSLESLSTRVEEGELRQLNLVIKADVNGSLEAIKASIGKIESQDIPIKILRAATGAINENDVMLAKASDALILGFGVSSNGEARRLAEADDVQIKTYKIIYEMLDDIESVITGLYRPEFEEVELGQAEVRQMFKFSKVGVIAGCYIQSGLITRNASARIMRDGDVAFEGKIESLKRFKDDVKEVKEGYECGIVLEDFNDFKEGDLIVAFKMEQIKK